MVTSSNSGGSPLLIDLIGASLFCAGLFGCAYFTFGGGESAARTMRELTQEVSASGRNLATLRAAKDRQATALAASQRQLESGRQLPASIPLEEYLQALSRLADEYGLKIVRHNPLNARVYPGLLEQRFAYEVTGTLPDIAAFFKSVESAESWIDIGYLRIESPAEPDAVMVEQRRATLTLSLFSAPQIVPPAPPPSNG